MARAIWAAVAFALDVLVLAAVAAAALVVSGHGGQFELWGWSLSVTSLRNSLTIAFAAVVGSARSPRRSSSNS